MLCSNPPLSLLLRFSLPGRFSCVVFVCWGPSPKSPSIACVAVGDIVTCLPWSLLSCFTVPLPSPGRVLGGSFGLLIYTLLASCPSLEWFPCYGRGNGRLRQNDKPFIVLMNDQISISVTVWQAEKKKKKKKEKKRKQSKNKSLLAPFT